MNRLVPGSIALLSLFAASSCTSDAPLAASTETRTAEGPSSDAWDMFVAETIEATFRVQPHVAVY
jgi:hypothetical protein